MSDIAEVGAALTMLPQFFIGLWYLCAPDLLPSTKLACIGAMAHAPFSIALHIHRARSNNALMRTRWYKLDVAFMHVNMLLVGYAWSMRPQYHHIVFHGGCFVHLLRADPLTFPNVKPRIDVIVAFGVLECSLGSLFRDQGIWLQVIGLYTLAFFTHNRKIIGRYSSGLMHLVLAVTQYYTIWSLSQNIAPSWGYM
jgi:hypothetical protein